MRRRGGGRGYEGREREEGINQSTTIRLQNKKRKSQYCTSTMSSVYNNNQTNIIPVKSNSQSNLQSNLPVKSTTHPLSHSLTHSLTHDKTNTIKTPYYDSLRSISSFRIYCPFITSVVIYSNNITHHLHESGPLANNNLNTP